MSVDAALGYEFQHWAARLVGLFGYWVSLLEGAERANLTLSTEEATADSEETPIRLDVRMADSRRRFLLIGEIKWTRIDAVGMLSKALAYAFKVQATHRVVVVGAPTEILKKLSPKSVYEACRNHSPTVLPNSRFEVTDRRTGTLICDLEAPNQRVTVFLIAFSESLTYEFAKALALRLTSFSPTKTERGRIPLGLEALAESVFDPMLRNLLDVPIRSDTALSLDTVLAKFPADRLLLDPWSYLAQSYLRHQSQRTPKRYRWVRLLQAALKRQCGNDPNSLQLLLSEGALAAKIPPLPLRCGRRSGREIISELESASLTNSESPPRPTREIRLLTGTAGTGKSTLLEFLFNNHIDRLRRGTGAAPSIGLPIFIDLQRDSEILKSLYSLRSELSHSQRRGIVAEVLARLTGYAQNESESKDPSQDRGQSGSRFTRLEALMLHYQLYLYIDGFDQLSSADNRLLIVLGREMRILGYDMVFLVLASRPHYDELRAFDWEATFPGVQVPTVQSILTLSPPERFDLEEYCQGWLDELAAILKVQRRSDSESTRNLLQAGHFLDRWLPESTESNTAVGRLGIAQDTRPRAIQNNPLLLAMTLAIYLQRVGTEAFDSNLVLLTQSDLFESLLQELPNPDHPINSRTGGLSGTSVLAESVWRAWFERCCFLSLMTPGKTVGRMSRRLVEKEWSTSGVGRTFNPAELNLPFLQTNENDELQNTTLDFIHPAFHEYLAASFVARCLTEEKFPLLEGEFSLLPFKDATALRLSDGILVSPFGHVIVGLGRDAFKYLWGCLLREWRHKPRFDEDTGLSRLAALLERDYAVQQYLYDAGYVDRCLDELEFARPGVIQRNGYDALRKLIGHTYYGKDDGLEQGIAELLHLTESVLRGRLSTLDRWTAIFCLDHVENRLFRAQEDRIKLALTNIDHKSSILDVRPLSDWIRDRWSEVTLDLGLFGAAMPDDGSRDLPSRSMLDVPEPKWNTESQFILRAGHYWGHVGNRVLVRQTRTPSANLREDRILALDAYARAVVYRLVALFQTLGKRFEEEIENAMGDQVALPAWFRNWVRSGESERSQDWLEHDLISFERFLGPGQAIADTANQFSCRTNLLLWEVAFAEGRENMERQLGLAEKEYRSSENLWQLAKSDRVLGFQGESLIRYFLHLAGLDTRMEMCRLVIGGKERWSKEEVRFQAQRKLTALERDYGMSYALAWTDVFDSCEAFRQVLFKG